MLKEARMSEKLLPCPFCDSDYVRIEPDEAEPTMFVVHCHGPKCDVRVGFFNTEGQAAEAWNRRKET